MKNKKCYWNKNSNLCKKEGGDQNIFYKLIQIHGIFMNLRGMKICKQSQKISRLEFSNAYVSLQSIWFYETKTLNTNKSRKVHITFLYVPKYQIASIYYEFKEHHIF